MQVCTTLRKFKQLQVKPDRLIATEMTCYASNMQASQLRVLIWQVLLEVELPGFHACMGWQSNKAAVSIVVVGFQVLRQPCFVSNADEKVQCAI